MKTIYFVRHAKASKAFPELKDIDRPLMERGYLDAHNIGKELKKKKNIPELLVSSHAVRALTTALIFAQELKYPYRDIVIEEKLYSEDYKDILKTTASYFDKYNSVMFFGHNPSFEKAIQHLSKEKFEVLVTSGVVAFKFDGLLIKHKSDLAIELMLHPKRE